MYVLLSAFHSSFNHLLTFVPRYQVFPQAYHVEMTRWFVPGDLAAAMGLPEPTPTFHQLTSKLHLCMIRFVETKIAAIPSFGPAFQQFMYLRLQKSLSRLLGDQSGKFAMKHAPGLAVTDGTRDLIQSRLLARRRMNSSLAALLVTLLITAFCIRRTKLRVSAFNWLLPVLVRRRPRAARTSTL